MTENVLVYSIRDNATDIAAMNLPTVNHTMDTFSHNRKMHKYAILAIIALVAIIIALIAIPSNVTRTIAAILFLPGYAIVYIGLAKLSEWNPPDSIQFSKLIKYEFTENNKILCTYPDSKYFDTTSTDLFDKCDIAYDLPDGQEPMLELYSTRREKIPYRIHLHESDNPEHKKKEEQEE